MKNYQTFPSLDDQIQFCEDRLTEYRSLKRSCEFGFFFIFTTYTIDLVVFGYLGIASLSGCTENDVIGMLRGCSQVWDFKDSDMSSMEV